MRESVDQLRVTAEQARHDSFRTRSLGPSPIRFGRIRFCDPPNDLNEAKRLNGWNDLNPHSTKRLERLERPEPLIRRRKAI